MRVFVKLKNGEALIRKLFQRIPAKKTSQIWLDVNIKGCPRANKAKTAMNLINELTFRYC